MAGSCDGCCSRLGHSHFAVIEEHAIHLLDGLVGSLLGLEVDKGITLRAVLITNHLSEKRQVTCVCWPDAPAGTKHQPSTHLQMLPLLVCFYQVVFLCQPVQPQAVLWSA